jgi:hypothetical protein
MTLQDACYSLKLECALRDLGFVENGWRVVAHAGIYFIEPVGLIQFPSEHLLGFQLLAESSFSFSRAGLHLGSPLATSAKRAIDMAFSLS